MASSDVLFNQAIDAFRAGRLDDAERRLKSVLTRQPRHVAALNILGVLLATKEKYQEAESYLRSALKINSNSETTFYNMGIVLKGLGRPAEALEHFSKAVAINPKVAETWNNRGTVQNDLHRYEEALGDFDKAIALLPNFPAAFCNKGKSLERLKRYEEAFAAYDTALALTPNLTEAWLGRGNVLAILKRYDDAFAAYGQALALKPDLAEAWLGRGNVFAKLERYGEALAAYERVLGLNPHDAATQVSCGNALLGLERHDEALAAFDKALELEPELADAWLGRGNVFYESRRYDEAFAAYDRVLAWNSECAEGWLGRGNALTGLKRHDEAFAAFDRALELSPDPTAAWLGRGNVLADLKRYDEALDAYDKALALTPDLVKAWMGRGNACSGLKRYDQALSAYDHALAKTPSHVGAWLCRGQILFELKRYEESVTAFDKAVELEPDLAEGWLGRGSVFFEVRQYNDALPAYDKAFKLNPDLPGLEGYRLSTKMQLCDWKELDSASTHLIASMRDGHLNTHPFVLFGIESSSSDQLFCARGWNADAKPAENLPIWRGERYKHDRIRIAYLSADFRDHAVAHLLVGTLEQHDRARFEVVGLSTAADDNSEIQKRIKKSFDRVLDIGKQGDAEVTQLIREMEIDIVVDLMGFTQGTRSNVLASHPAPIQVNYLGYPGTMGTKYIDYILADRTIIPETQRDFYAEKVVYLPDTYMPADSGRKLSARLTHRADCGLPESGFVFCSFNNNSKITPQVFDIWMALLRQVEGSILWLSSTNEAAMRNLKIEAQSRGVDPDRILFASRAALNEDHLARLALADLALDTLPYNGHTTTSDALWAGLPVLTYLGNTFAARVSASLLQAIRLPELITTSLNDYERTAIDLATDSTKLALIRQKLADHRLTTPLFDTKTFTAHIENAFATMYERHQSGLAPDHFAVVGPNIDIPKRVEFDDPVHRSSIDFSKNRPAVGTS
ncbi:MAG: protein O-GlcNAc transferase [Alphaproteobacteria bacterium]|nr:protein O-GlcNAc transferase [Alphaproteobacteria bacterium]